MNFFQKLFGKKKAKPTPEPETIIVETGASVVPDSRTRVEAVTPPPPPEPQVEDMSGNGNHLDIVNATPESVAQETLAKRRAKNGRFVKGVGGLDCVARDSNTGRFKSKA